MSHPNEAELYQKLRDAGLPQQGQQTVGTVGTGGVLRGNVGCAMPSLRERIANQRYRAEKESNRLQQLAELEFLLDKHPEVARILEFLEIVGQVTHGNS